MLGDLKFAIRQLRKSPGFTLAAVFTLALGIAALTTVFTWIKAVLYDPYPHVTDPRSLRFIDATVRSGGSGYNVNYSVLEFLRERNHSLENLTAFTLNVLDLASPGAVPEVLASGEVSSSYFQLLGLRPQLGTFFDPTADDRVYGSHDEVVLSDRVWRVRFDADAHIVGRTISLNRHPFTVIGVAPRDFTGIYGGAVEQLWVPLSALRSLQPDPGADPLPGSFLMFGGRLRPGVSSDAAAAELHTLASQYAQQEEARGHNMGGWDLNLRDSAHFERGLFGVIGENVPVLLSAAGLLLVLVCINTASLLGQRAARRRHEIAIRTSLGATSRRIGTQLFTEALLLATMGGAVGWAASLVLAQSLYALLPTFGLQLSFNFSTDWRVISLVAAVVIAVALLCGMIPVRQALRSSQKDALHEGSPSVLGSSRNRWGKVVVLGLQLGMCFVVLVGSALLMRTLLNVLHQVRGFDRENVLTASLSLERAGYSEDKGLVLLTTLLDEMRKAPGVSDVTVTSHLPMGDFGSGNVREFSIPGYTFGKNETTTVITDLEGPEFFRTMRIAMAQGREFTSQDRTGAPLVAVINQDMADRYWPRGNALGSTIIVRKQPCQIVGIVKNYAYYSPRDTDPTAVVYLPFLQHYQGDAFIAMRSRTTTMAPLPQLKQAVGRLDNALPLENVESLRNVGEIRYQFVRIPVEMLSVFALASLLVATLGLYAVMAYAVTERTREFALRMAVGANRMQIVRLVMNGGMETVLAGLLIGSVGGFFAVRLLRSLLFGVAPFDPVSFIAAAIVLVATVLLAGLGPARRAATIQPMEALRTE
jgi:predicted permease